MSDYEYQYEYDPAEDNYLKNYKKPPVTLLSPMEDLDLFIKSVDAYRDCISDNDATEDLRWLRTARFDWQWKQTTSTPYRTGSVESATRTPLLGFGSLVEFKAKCHPLDKELAYQHIDTITTEYALASSSMDRFQFCFWLAYNQGQTRSGAWAVTVDDDQNKTRDIFIYVNKRLSGIGPIAQEKTTQLNLGML